MYIEFIFIKIAINIVDCIGRRRIQTRFSIVRSAMTAFAGQKPRRRCAPQTAMFLFNLYNVQSLSCILLFFSQLHESTAAATKRLQPQRQPFKKTMQRRRNLWEREKPYNEMEICTYFCRYAPTMESQIMTFQVEGIHITKDPYDDCSKTRCRVTLDNLGISSTGTYRCEVSGDAPTFRLTYETANMTIIGMYFCYVLAWCSL